jgi:hypothetical protein
MTATSIDIGPARRRLVVGILRTHRCSVRVRFAHDGTGPNYSDPDLAIDAGSPLSPDATGALSESFSDSDRPYRVDIVDWRGEAAIIFAGLSLPTGRRCSRAHKWRT